MSQLYTTQLIFSKITKMNSIKRELDTMRQLHLNPFQLLIFILNSFSVSTALY